MKALVLLLCLYFLVLSTDARPNFQPVSRFDASKILDVKLYQPFSADNVPSPLFACTRELFTPIGNGKIIAQSGNYVPGPNGELTTILLIVKQVGNSGTFKIVGGDAPSGYAYILDYDYRNYDWAVYGLDLEGDAGDLIALVSRTPQNLVGLERALKLAKKYQMNCHHLELQTTKCDYYSIFAELKKERKNIW